jgi:hypothetical protein
LSTLLGAYTKSARTISQNSIPEFTSQAVYFNNRAAVYLKMGEFSKALVRAELQTQDL